MWAKLKEWIYPSKCIVCGKLIDLTCSQYDYLCPQCNWGILEHNVCEKCGKPYAMEEECIYCGELPRAITQVKSIFPYTDLYKESILRWKYSGIRKYAKGYGELIATQLIMNKNLDIELLIPIPISDKRYEKRGFNQALDLAQIISGYTKIPVWDGLRRVKNTKPQSACSKEERICNIKGTIEYNERMGAIDAKKIALIDDIYTTGSTVNECVRVIKGKNSQVEEVLVFAVCLAV